jgi:Arc/MetJ-type ribon-helix-helix transcriptional regulator
MKKVSVSLREDHVDRLDERQDEGTASSRSDAIREILDEYEDMSIECEELRTECEQLRNRRDELRRQLQERGDVEEKVETLVERTERQDDALARVLERQEEGLVGRWKRKLFGTPNDEDAVTTDDGAVEEDGVAASRTGD